MRKVNSTAWALVLRATRSARWDRKCDRLRQSAAELLGGSASPLQTAVLAFLDLVGTGGPGGVAGSGTATLLRATSNETGTRSGWNGSNNWESNVKALLDHFELSPHSSTVLIASQGSGERYVECTIPTSVAAPQIALLATREVARRAGMVGLLPDHDRLDFDPDGGVTVDGKSWEITLSGDDDDWCDLLEACPQEVDQPLAPAPKRGERVVALAPEPETPAEWTGQQELLDWMGRKAACLDARVIVGNACSLEQAHAECSGKWPEWIRTEGLHTIDDVRKLIDSLMSDK